MCENEKKLVRTQNVLTFKPRYKKCPDFARGSLPTPGHPGKNEFRWESLMPIFRLRNRRHAYWSKIVPTPPTGAPYPKNRFAVLESKIGIRDSQSDSFEPGCPGVGRIPQL